MHALLQLGSCDMDMKRQSLALHAWMETQSFGQVGSGGTMTMTFVQDPSYTAVHIKH